MNVLADGKAEKREREDGGGVKGIYLTLFLLRISMRGEIKGHIVQI